jgi:prepilin-type N-terminal cleavage/methylation domain-containing protein
MQSYTKKGFTILEILLVIALLAILFATVLYAFNPNKIITEVNDNKRQADALNLYQALEQYALKTGSYPANIQNTVNIPPGASLGICKTAAEQVGGSTNCSGKIDLRILVPDYISNIPSYSSEINDSGYYIVKDANRKIGIGGFKGTDNSQFVQGLSKQTFDAIAINDPYWSNVSLLLKFDDSNGSTTFIDSSSSNLSITGVGDTKISTVQSKFGGSSACFDGNGDYLTLDSTSSLYNFNSDFTIEGWFYKTDNQDDIIIASPQGGPSNNQIFRVNGNSIGIYQDAWIFNMESYSIPLNTWHHFAYTRSGINNYLFINGTQVGTVKAYSGIFRIGSIGRDIWGINQYTGCIDDLRLTKGVARYTTNFTPPTQSFTPPPPASPSNTNISLLMNCNGSSFVDSSIYARAITIQAGTPSLSSVQSKFGSKSCLLNSGSSLGFNDTTELDLTGDFTIESWIYPLSTGAGDRIVAGHSSQNVQIFRINEGGSGTGTLSFYLNGTQVFSPVAAGITPNNWYHVAISRSGTVTKMFVNGVQVGSNNTTWSGSFKINRIGVFWLNSYFDGYIDDFRVTKGVSWYNGNFTPPTAQLTP